MRRRRAPEVLLLAQKAHGAGAVERAYEDGVHAVHVNSTWTVILNSVDVAVAQ
ncbi:hypothetical protein [Pseudarthrobacter sulfonivorans]|uniref:hypothetical protein n=1 Tax=Pseudarthrobacter sulfonivorans TaxID=121292 RepID=UPI0012FD6EE9|nr:hypothetical protein [Pseudarthrobacter sulfonivorans]